MSRSIRFDQYIKENRVLCDGAFGTYYSHLFETDELPEYANMEHRVRVKEIHKEYLQAGATMIRTNTFACNSYALHKDLHVVLDYIENACEIAKEAVTECAEPETRFIAADIGPIHFDYGQETLVQEEYVAIVKKFLSLGMELFIFETFSSLEDIRPAIEEIADQAFVIVQFAVNQYGYSTAGLSAHRLFQEAHACPYVDAVGLNCGVGPGHMLQVLKSAVGFSDRYISALPNAGYPQIVRNRMAFSNNNLDYFVNKSMELAENGVRILGGCCGTTPDYIRAMAKGLQDIPVCPFPAEVPDKKEANEKENHSFFAGKENQKLIAVELAPPVGSDAQVLMDAAHLLKACHVDVVTFPDSPSGRTRADSILMAEKVARETGLCVMPHICCRDKNAIAMRSQMLGAYINEIYNFLVITGDPVPSVMRNSVESVFSFDSVGLMHILGDMNGEVFGKANLTYGGAINQGRRNLSVEIQRVKKKMQAGASFFLSQPVFSQEDMDRLKQIKAETGARILYGIMPFVSLKNAVFMKNEMTGINVTDEVLSKYRADMTREEGEAVGVALAVEMMKRTYGDADGYYFSFPFNRVHMLKSIMSSIDEKG